MCERCAELEAENADLRRELAYELSLEASHVAAESLGLTPTEGRLVFALYQAAGRTLSKAALDSCIPATLREERQDLKFVDVMVCRIRKKLGMGFIETVWGRGHRLSDAGNEVCAKALLARSRAA